MCRSPSYLKSTHDNKQKYVGIPNYFILVKILYKSCFQFSGVSLTELINENALWLATNFSVAPIKLFVTTPAASVASLILCIAKFIK